MPSTSSKQHNFMAAVANNPAFAKKAGVPQSVGAEFMKADKGKKFGSGDGSRADLQAINKPKVHRGKMKLFAEGGDMKESKAMMKKEVGFMKKAGAPRSMIKHEESEMKGMKMGGKAKKMNMSGMMKYAGGGMPMVMKNGKKVPAFAADGKGKMAHGGLAAGHKQADGIASKGKTRGMQVKMAGGGMKK
jgi:hypothetical protein